MKKWHELSMEDAGEAYQLMLDLIEQYEQLGPIPGIALPFIEAFLPFLPLIAFVIANGAAYGLFKGFIYSWIGSSLGMIMVFLLIRKFADKRIFKRIKADRRVKKVTSWVGENGFGPLFLLLCFPFSPSALINVVAALSNVGFRQFALAVLLGKTLMIFSVTYIGSSIVEFASHPAKTVMIIGCIVIFWVFGTYLERKLLHKQNKITRKGG